MQNQSFGSDSSGTTLSYATPIQTRLRHSRLCFAAGAAVVWDVGLFTADIVRPAAVRWAQWDGAGVRLDVLVAGIGWLCCVVALVKRNRRRWAAAYLLVLTGVGVAATMIAGLIAFGITT